MRSIDLRDAFIPSVVYHKYGGEVLDAEITVMRCTSNSIRVERAVLYKQGTEHLAVMYGFQWLVCHFFRYIGARSISFA